VGVFAHQRQRQCLRTPTPANWWGWAVGVFAHTRQVTAGLPLLNKKEVFLLERQHPRTLVEGRCAWRPIERAVGVGEPWWPRTGNRGVTTAGTLHRGLVATGVKQGEKKEKRNVNVTTSLWLRRRTGTLQVSSSVIFRESPSMTIRRLSGTALICCHSGGEESIWVCWCCLVTNGLSRYHDNAKHRHRWSVSVESHALGKKRRRFVCWRLLRDFEG